MSDTDEQDPLAAVVKALKPLQSDKRQRTIEAAMHYLGETPSVKVEPVIGAGMAGQAFNVTEYPPTVNVWCKQHHIGINEIDRVFLFNADGSFQLNFDDAPGKTKKEKTVNIYILTGLGTYLATGQRKFDDTTARRYCQEVGCYDAANHSLHLAPYKEKGHEFSGDKDRGYTITNPGLKRGAILIKELAGID
jgi:hypothetical protein